MKINADLARTFPPEMIYRIKFFPVEWKNGRLEVAMVDPENPLFREEIETFIGAKILPLKISEEEFDEEIRRIDLVKGVLEEASEEFAGDELMEVGEEEVSVETLTLQESSIVKLVNSIVFSAVHRGASDIHIEATDKNVKVKYRIDGVLYPAMEPIHKKFHSGIISRIKVMADLDIAEKRIPQDGRFQLRIKGKKIDFRVSILPGSHGEECVIRILDKEHLAASFKELTLDKLGFDEDIVKKIRKHIRLPYGMFLVTGPTGSGKTTTLYAALNEIVTEEEKIITIEDPVEYTVPGVLQIPVNEKKGLTFARGLRSILRHDPDRIMVGEIRDPETAEIAVQAALTGHLVMTTVHANNVFDVISRFVHMGIDLHSLVSALNAVLAQRLVRKLCENCKVETKYSPEVLEDNGLDPKVYSKHTFYKPGGCEFCNHTGYRGRMAIGEFLELSDSIKEMIVDRKPARLIKNEARKQGMEFIREKGMKRVLEGITSLEELNKVSFASLEK